MRFIRFFMFLALLVGVQHLQAQKVWDGSIADGFESGSGTKESPYEIQTPEQFAYFIQAINKGETFYEKEIVMTRDISLNNIALGANDNTCFSGVFNGLGHVIYDMYCKSSTPAFSAGRAQMFYSLEGIICNLAVQGKFESTRSSAFVKNVKSLGIIYNCKLDISMNVDAGDELFMIASNNDGSIVDCSVAGNITCSKGYYWSTRYDDGYYEDGIFYATLGNIFGEDYINGRNTTVGSIEQLEEWVACHPEIKKTSCDYTESTCTIEITDPEGVVVSPNISARNGISFGGISLPTTGFDCTVTGYKWRGKTLDKNAVIDREIVNVYPVYTRTIREQPTSENPTIVVDDKAHAQYNWYKRADLFGDWEYSKESSTNACKSFNINVEAGDVLSFWYFLNDAEEYSDYFIVTLDGDPICSRSGDSFGSFKYYFPTSGSHTLEFKVDLKSANDVSLYVSDIRNTNELLIDNNTTNTLFVNGNNIENGAEYYCKVTYTNSSTILYSNPFVVIKEEAEVDTDITGISNTIYFDNIDAFCGKTIEIPIKMKNDIAATGFQFDIILPEGITAVLDEDGFYDITLSTERTTAAKTNTFDSSLMSDGSIRVLAASTRNYAFSGNDGEVCKIKLHVSEDIPAGDYPIILKTIELTNALGQTWNVERLKRTITVKDYQLGDANGDGRVSVGDFSAIANHILGTTPEGFNLGAADANQDNNISVGDLSTVATMILTEEAGGASKAKAMARRSAELSDPNNYIYASPVTISEDGDATIVFNMKNAIAATGFQFNFKLPKGFSVTEDEDGFLDVFLSQTRTTSRKTNTFDCVKWSDGSYRVLAASTKNYEFSGNDGEVVTVHIQKDDDVESGDYALVLTDIELTNAQGETFRTTKASYTITVPSNSNEIALIDGEPYDNTTTTTCDKLTFTKTFSASAAGNWNAFYVPMSVNVEEYVGDLDFAEIYAFCATVDTNGDGVVDADDENFLFVRPVKTESIKPNVPYLIRPREAKTYVINSADNVLHKATEGKVEFGTTIEKYTVTGLNNSFTVTAGDNNFYVSATGKLNYRTTGSTTVKANRWIMHRVSMEYGGGDNNDIAGAKEYRIITMGEDIDEATAIKLINASDSNRSGVYTIDGRKVNDDKTLPNGVYIKSGKKIIINK